MEVQEGVALAEGGVELGGVWGLAEEKDWAFKLSHLFCTVVCHNTASTYVCM